MFICYGASYLAKYEAMVPFTEDENTSSGWDFTYKGRPFKQS